MRLKTLRLHGFKSFADRTTLDFRDGVTAIVGSNGCGKSNIADSIRWVLGEQRASVIRGAKMEEVIFQGTARRRPLNFAEVSLLFDNESGRIPVPQTELEISRKVFREGGSEYALNRNACRLRDIHGLLRDTGLGSNAYAIIESTMIETLLSDRAEERRTLFEEAAGIGRYKDNRRAAERRLEAAEGDLRRLEDLIAEVESKVRSLARQKRKAERHQELRTRKLDLEVALARSEVARLENELANAERERARLDEEQRVGGADRSAAESQLEERRIEASDLGRQRMEVAARLEAVRERLDERERAILIAEERRSHAESRIQELVRERGDLLGRIERYRCEVEELEAARGERELAAARAREIAEQRASEALEVRQALTAERARAERAAEESRRLTREIAAGEGERAGAETRGRDAREQLLQLRADLERVEHELAQMHGQTELWEAQSEEVREALERATEEVDVVREEVRVNRSRETRARDDLRAAEERWTALTTQVGAREALERSYDGFAPAVAAIMSAGDAFPGVHGPLADYIRESGDDAKLRSLESYLGPMLQALVVEDLAAARAIRDWFRSEWTEGGTLVILPLEALPRRAEGAERIDGKRWAAQLLEHVEIVSDDPLRDLPGNHDRIGPRGDIVTAAGVVRLGDGAAEQGILARREALQRLRGEAEAAQRDRDARILELDSIRVAIAESDDRLQEAEERRRVIERQLQHLQLDTEEHLGRRGRLEQERQRISRLCEELERTAADAEARLEEVRTRLTELSAAVGGAAEAETSARESLQALEERWDSVREAEAEARIALAAAESDVRETERAWAAAKASRDGAERRFHALEEEATSRRAELEQLSGSRESASEDLASLFAERDQHTGALAILDARLAEVDSELAELGERARVARRRESEASEGRHKLELQIAETGSRLERVRERLEAEWGRPWTVLVSEATPLEGDPEAWRSEVREVTAQLESLGPVNMLALEEHAEEQRRLGFLAEQRDDLVEARDNLAAAIRQINRTAREAFQSTFETVRANFRRTFQSLFQGGECDLWLFDPEDPLESPVEIQASPKGKRTQRIHLLSGGERTLTALALLFALYLVKPSPFCVLDEIDAPLDESNVGRFIQLLNDFKHETQFIVITHNPRTMEAADWVYGVTMEDPGVSSIVGVELTGTWALDADSSATV